MLNVDDINLLDDDVVMSLLQAINDGFVVVEREGMSVRYPCQPLLIATFNADDAELKESFKGLYIHFSIILHSLSDRIGLSLSTDDYPLSVEERMEVANRVNDFLDGTMNMTAVYVEENCLRERVKKARQRLHNIKISHDQLLFLCQEASKGLCEGQRAEINAARVAIAVAALRGETDCVSPDDLRIAARLAIFPRSRILETEEEEDIAPPQYMPPSPPEKDSPPEEMKSDEEEVLLKFRTTDLDFQLDLATGGESRYRNRNRGAAPYCSGICRRCIQNPSQL